MTNSASHSEKTPGLQRLTLPLWTQTHAAPPLPMTIAEVKARGWQEVDVVFDVARVAEPGPGVPRDAETAVAHQGATIALP